VGLNIQGPVTAGIVILFGSIGLSVGDLLAGSLSQVMKSRKRAVALHLCVAFALMLVYFFAPGLTNKTFYALCFLLGISVGYWAVLVTMAAEQFGTNIRGTVATTVPNFVRGSAALAAGGFAYLKGQMTVSSAALTVGVICFSLALLALLRVDETFHRDLDYDEGSKGA